jgi:hypothetical protein
MHPLEYADYSDLLLEFNPAYVGDGAVDHDQDHFAGRLLPLFQVAPDSRHKECIPSESQPD